MTAIKGRKGMFANLMGAASGKQLASRALHRLRLRRAARASRMAARRQASRAKGRARTLERRLGSWNTESQCSCASTSLYHVPIEQEHITSREGEVHERAFFQISPFLGPFFPTFSPKVL